MATLVVTALGAEMAAVGASARGNRFALTGAYLAAISCFWNPVAALLTAVAAVVLSGSLRRLSAGRVAVKAGAAGAASLVASLAMGFLPGEARTGESAPIGAILFMAVYGAVGHVVMGLARRAPGSWREAFRRVSPLHLAAYVLAGPLVAVLARDRLTWVVPFTLVPVWAFRLGLMRRDHLAETYYDTITALTLMLQRAHPYTQAHLDRVARTAELVAQQLGLSERRAELVRTAAVLHDIGKIAVDENVLDKPGPLTHEERTHVEKHPLWGAMILSPIQEFKDLVPWIRSHHERPDGTGYPDRLSGGAIPVESKIIAVVDAFDAMTGGDRNYRAPMSQEEAILELKRCTRTQFDEAVVEAFSQVLSEATA
ncbi:MAG TPA: HD-GYP domain-containing protein [Fimbriimonadaceae bacterium]|nr:HD-GYP domain-containing protein [Fimbriimonadaceae bacterium]